jgi:hypothetical protein
VRFASVAPAARLAVGSELLSREEQGSADDDPAEAQFVVPYQAFARALLSYRPLLLDGSPFAATFTVNSMLLDADLMDDTSADSAE